MKISIDQHLYINDVKMQCVLQMTCVCAGTCFRWCCCVFSGHFPCSYLHRGSFGEASTASGRVASFVEASVRIACGRPAEAWKLVEALCFVSVKSKGSE